MMREKLVSEALSPVFCEAAGDTPMAVGEPVLPGAFRWRGAVYPVLQVLASGRGLGPCTHGSGEQYVRRHWYRIASAGGLEMRIYFERRPRSGGKASRRWWLYSTTSPDPGALEAGGGPAG